METPLALTLARAAFEGITRVDGTPYLGHLERVAARLPDRLAAAGLLHDIIEDTPETRAGLVAKGITERTAEIVEIVTRREGETYAAFIERIAGDPDATMVKLADLADNLTDGGGPPAGLRARYEAAVKRLGGTLPVRRTAFRFNPPPVGEWIDPAFNIRMKARVMGAARMVNQAVEAELVKQVEGIEGRVPSNEEVAKHGFCGILPDGRREYKWRGNTILIVHPMTYTPDHRLILPMDAPATDSTRPPAR